MHLYHCSWEGWRDEECPENECGGSHRVIEIRDEEASEWVKVLLEALQSAYRGLIDGDDVLEDMADAYKKVTGQPIMTGIE
jgi:hypothetical protein